MKTVKFNTFSIFVVALLAGSALFYLPVFLIETIWNNFIGITYTEYTINFWQALLLWLSLLTMVYLTGIFKFEIALESVDASEKDSFKDHIAALKKKAQEAAKSETDKATKESIDKN